MPSSDCEERKHSRRKLRNDRLIFPISASYRVLAFDFRFFFILPKK